MTAPVKLAELNPKWGAENGRHGQYVIFDCPACRGSERTHRLTIPLERPLDGAPIARYFEGKHHWSHSGSTFEDLTLSPSVHYIGHWHGWVIGGVVTTC